MTKAFKLHDMGRRAGRWGCAITYSISLKEGYYQISYGISYPMMQEWEPVNYKVCEGRGLMRIGFPGMGGRLRRAREQRGLTQEAVAEKVGVSWMTVLRWEHDQRSIPEEKLKRLGALYKKPLRWFLTLEEGDLEGPEARYRIARRLYQRVAEAPEKHQAVVERMVGNILEVLEGGEDGGQG
jgi:transcriptional regulator with XRE-family HTH domain